ncbi:MAG TPA: YdeI/OmpD-associated family protein, partial [Niabella sp.]
DTHPISGVFLLPMGDGTFILPVNAAMRKGIRKKEGAMAAVTLQPDAKKYELNRELMECLQEEQEVLVYFRSLPPSRQHYFSKWVDAAKTDATKVQRISRVVHALQNKWDYGQMIRFYKQR